MGTIIFLIVIGVGLIVLNMRAIKKEKHSFQGTLHNAEFDMSEVDVRIGELRREFTEDIAELQVELEEIKEKLNNLREEEANEKTSAKSKSEKSSKKKNDVKKKNLEEKNNIEANEIEDISEVNDNNDKNEKNKGNENKNIKINEVSKLLESGLTTDEVSHKLGISKGEVLLIKELYLK